MPNLRVVRDVAGLAVQPCACDTRIPPNREHALAGVSVRLLAKMAREGTIPGKKVGRQWRFLRSALRNWLVSSDDALERALDKKGMKYRVTKEKK